MASGEVHIDVKGRQRRGKRGNGLGQPRLHTVLIGSANFCAKSEPWKIPSLHFWYDSIVSMLLDVVLKPMQHQVEVLPADEVDGVEIARIGRQVLHAVQIK
jgi:hypothetical protein